MSGILYERETGEIIGACMEVHRELGNGFLEGVYQDALEIEFRERGIPHVREAKVTVFYKGRPLGREYYADFICHGKIVVELKCVSRLVNANKAQVINYLHGTKLQVGLLVNFGEASLKWERLTVFERKQTDWLASDDARGENKQTDLLAPNGVRAGGEDE